MNIDRQIRYWASLINESEEQSFYLAQYFPDYRNNEVSDVDKRWLTVQDLSQEKKFQTKEDAVESLQNLYGKLTDNPGYFGFEDIKAFRIVNVSTEGNTVNYSSCVLKGVPERREDTSNSPSGKILWNNDISTNDVPEFEDETWHTKTYEYR